MDGKKIIAQLPYSAPFLFVDEILQVDADTIRGSYQYPEDAYFYQGHFKDYPVTPGVILTETMAQIGLVALGIYLLGSDSASFSGQIALTSHRVDFFQPVYPGERVEVQSKKIYFRFHKLKCAVKMINQKGECICAGEISGMFRPKKIAP